MQGYPDQKKIFVLRFHLCLWAETFVDLKTGICYFLGNDSFTQQAIINCTSVTIYFCGLTQQQRNPRKLVINEHLMKSQFTIVYTTVYTSLDHIIKSSMANIICTQTNLTILIL